MLWKHAHRRLHVEVNRCRRDIRRPFCTSSTRSAEPLAVHWVLTVNFLPIEWHRRLSYLRNVTRPGRTTRQGYTHTMQYQSRTRFVDTRIAPKLRCDFPSEVRTSLTSGAYHVPSPTSRRTDREVKLQEPKELVATPNIRSYTHTVSSQQIRQHSKNNLDTTASTRA